MCFDSFPTTRPSATGLEDRFGSGHVQWGSLAEGMPKASAHAASFEQFTLAKRGSCEYKPNPSDGRIAQW